jgi:hypothetical protein
MTRPPNSVRAIPRQLSRRTLLGAACGAGVALPLLEAMMPRTAQAQATAIPKRFGLVFSPCGTIPENWTPKAGNPSTTTPSPTNPAISTSFTLSPILSPLAPYQGDIVVLRGISVESTQGKYSSAGNAHDQGMTHMLTSLPIARGPAGQGRALHVLDGSASGPSIDQHIAAAIGQGTRIPSLELGVESTSTFLETLVTHMSYGKVDPSDPFKRAVPIPPVDDPVQVYARLFGGMNPALLKKRKSVLDHCISDYKDLMSKLGSSDRGKLDQHLTQIRQLEGSLATLINSPACPGALGIMPVTPARTQCLRDALGRGADTTSANYCVTNFAEIGKMQMDLMVLALSCDVTRVASLMWSTAESTNIHSGLDLQFTGTKEHHLLSHNETVGVAQTSLNADQAAVNVVRSDLTKINTWYAQQFAYLVGKLKGITEGNGKTLLDNMLLTWCNELGVGGVHSYTNIPYVLAGSCQGALETGRYLDFIGPSIAAGPVAVPYGKGPAHTKLFVSFLQKLGINENSFNFTGLPGEEALFTGPLAGL